MNNTNMSVSFAQSAPLFAHMAKIPFQDISTIFQLKNSNIYEVYKDGYTEAFMTMLKHCNSKAFEHHVDTKNRRNTNFHLYSSGDMRIAFLDYEYFANADIEHHSVLCIYDYTEETGTNIAKINPLFLLGGQHVPNIQNKEETVFAISEMAHQVFEGEIPSFEKLINPSQDEAKKGICYADNIFTTICSGELMDVKQISDYWLNKESSKADDQYEYIRGRDLKKLMEELQSSYQENAVVLPHSDNALYLHYARGVH